MTSSRPADTLRLLLSLWLDEVEEKAAAMRLRPEDPEMAAKLHARTLDLWLVRRVRAFLAEHPRQ